MVENVEPVSLAINLLIMRGWEFNCSMGVIEFCGLKMCEKIECSMLR